MRTSLPLALLACGAICLPGCPEDSPDQPCELDCGAHGRCVISQGREG